MKFEEILPALKEGKKIRRKIWSSDEYIVLKERVFSQDGILHSFSYNDFVAKDWEVIKDKRSVRLRDLTFEQYKNWYENNCNKLKCEDCIFCYIRCGFGKYNWVKNKDLYSDKFLDQEIEIDE